MRNIVLFCAAGMSTSLLVNKMKDYAASINYECKIEAYPISKAQECGAAADICLLGPQVRFNMDAVKKQVSCPVEAIDMKAYGMMDGKAVIEAVRKTLGD